MIYLCYLKRDLFIDEADKIININAELGQYADKGLWL